MCDRRIFAKRNNDYRDVDDGIDVADASQIVVTLIILQRKANYPAVNVFVSLKFVVCHYDGGPHPRDYYIVASTLLRDVIVIASLLRDKHFQDAAIIHKSRVHI